jgi:hypothetical protein
MGGCVLPTKLIAIKYDIDSNGNGSSFKSSIAWSGFCAKLKHFF